MKCAQCGTELNDGAAFCNQCGTKINVCPKCGYNNHPEARFCRSCGWELSQEIPVPVEVPTPVTPQPNRSDNPEKKKHSFGRILLTIAIILIIGMLLGTAVFWGVRHFRQDKSGEESNQETAIEIESPESTTEETTPYTTEPSPDEEMVTTVQETTEASVTGTPETSNPEVTEAPTPVEPETPATEISEPETVASAEETPFTNALQYVDQPGTWNGHAYAALNIVTLRLDSYVECESYCESMGGHLAVINSQEENDYIFQYLQGNDYETAFFGYSDREEEGVWKWVYGDSDYTNWAPGQPNNGAVNPGGEKEHYAHFFTDADRAGMWNDAPFGSNSKYIVCEWE